MVGLPGSQPVEISADDFKSVPPSPAGSGSSAQGLDSLGSVSSMSSSNPLASGVTSPAASTKEKCSLSTILWGLIEVPLAPYYIYTNFTEMAKVWGLKWVIFLFTFKWLVIAFFQNLILACQQWVLKDFHVEASQLMIMTTAAVWPYARKPLMGLLADIVPIYGYHKWSRMVGWNIVAIFCSGTLLFALYSTMFFSPANFCNHAHVFLYVFFYLTLIPFFTENVSSLPPPLSSSLLLLRLPVVGSITHSSTLLVFAFMQPMHGFTTRSTAHGG